MAVRYRPHVAIDPQGRLITELVGIPVTIVAAGTTTPLPISEDSDGSIPIAGSQLTVTSQNIIPGFWVQDDTAEADAISGPYRVSIDSLTGVKELALDSAAAAQAAQQAAETNVEETANVAAAATAATFTDTYVPRTEVGSTVETPAGAQAKADAAETEAKTYAGTLAYGTNLEATDAVVAGFVDDPGSQTRGALAGTFVARDSVYLTDYLTDGATPAENRTAYVAAVAAAEVGSKRLCYDGAFFVFEGAEVSSTADDMVHWASSWDTHLVTNVTRGRGVLVLEGERSIASYLHVDGDNPDLDLSGVTVGGSGQFRYSVGVRVSPTAHGSVLRNIRAGGFMCATVVSSVSPEVLVDGGPITEQLRECKVEGVYSDGCWTALQYFAPDGLTVTGLRGWYQDVIGSGGEGHIVYGSGYASGGTTWYADRVSIDDCDTDGGVAHGTTDFAGAYKISRHRYFSASNLRARNCPGLISVEYTSNFTIGYGVAGGNDIGMASAPLIQFFECSNGRVAPISVESSAQLPDGHDTMVIVRCVDVDFDRPTITVSPATSAITRGIVIYGACPGTRVLHPRVVNISPSANINTGVIVSALSGDVGASSGAEIVEPETVGSFNTGVRFALKGARLIFDGDKISGTKKIDIDSGITPYVIENIKAPLTPYRQPRTIGWHNGEASATSTPRVKTWPSGQQSVFNFGNGWTGDGNGRITEPENGGRRMFAAAFTADIDISVDVRLSTATRAGLCLRASGDSTYLAVSRTNGAVKVHKVAAGVTTELASAATSFPNNIFANLRAVIVGSTVFVFLNGAQIIEHTLTGGDESAYVSANHGLYGDVAAAAAWENVIVKSVA